MIVGIIPGPAEPDYSELSSYLRPLVKELNYLWTDGFPMQHNDNTVVISAALLATVCDVPATAKLGGFLGHMSNHACWKCAKVFPYSAALIFLVWNWDLCGNTSMQHKANALATLSAKTPIERNELELKDGSR